MHSITDWLDRFCYKHPRLGIPNLMMYIVIGNIAVYLLDNFSGGACSAMLAFIPAGILRGQLWRLVTFIFVPASGYNLIFFALFLYMYYFIGNMLEREWGSVKFTVYYGIGVLANIVVGLVLSVMYGANYAWSVVSVDYLNMSLFFAFAALYPDLQFLLFFIIPVKAKWLAWIDAAFFALSIATSLLNLSWTGVVLPLVAIANFLLFFWEDAARIFGRVRHQHSRQTINFKKATRDVKKEKGYLHKCAVCGITDADDPDMEFRYCSKCNGYYCYCMNHINNHVHIQ